MLTFSLEVIYVSAETLSLTCMAGFLCFVKAKVRTPLEFKRIHNSNNQEDYRCDLGSLKKTLRQIQIKKCGRIPRSSLQVKIIHQMSRSQGKNSFNEHINEHCKVISLKGNRSAREAVNCRIMMQGVSRTYPFNFLHRQSYSLLIKIHNTAFLTVNNI